MDRKTTAVHNNARKQNCAVKQCGLVWNWRYFITWLRIISLYPLTESVGSPSKVINGIALIIRFGLFVVNVVAHTGQLFLFYNLGYDAALATEYWNAVIDYWNWTAHTLVVHYFIVFIALRKNHWFELNQLLVKIDHFMEQYDSKTSLRLKNRSIMGLLYIISTVGLHSYKILRFIF
jgi:hypothetical protein